MNNIGMNPIRLFVLRLLSHFSKLNSIDLGFFFVRAVLLPVMILFLFDDIIPFFVQFREYLNISDMTVATKLVSAGYIVFILANLYIIPKFNKVDLKEEFYKLSTPFQLLPSSKKNLIYLSGLFIDSFFVNYFISISGGTESPLRLIFFILVVLHSYYWGHFCLVLGSFATFIIISIFYHSQIYNPLSLIAFFESFAQINNSLVQLSFLFLLSIVGWFLRRRDVIEYNLTRNTTEKFFGSLEAQYQWFSKSDSNYGLETISEVFNVQGVELILFDTKTEENHIEKVRRIIRRKIKGRVIPPSSETLIIDRNSSFYDSLKNKTILEIENDLLNELSHGPASYSAFERNKIFGKWHDIDRNNFINGEVSGIYKHLFDDNIWNFMISPLYVSIDNYKGSEKKLIGMLVLLNKLNRTNSISVFNFSVLEKNLFGAISELLASIIYNQSQNNKMQLQAAIKELIDDVAETSSIDPIIEHIGKIFNHLTNSTRYSFWIYDEIDKDNKHLVLQKAHDVNPLAFNEPTFLKIDDSVIGLALKEGNTLFSKNPALEYPNLYKWKETNEGRSIFASPLITPNGYIVGVIATHPNQQEFSHSNNLKILEEFGRFASLLFDHASLKNIISKTSEFRKEVEILNKKRHKNIESFSEDLVKLIASSTSAEACSIFEVTSSGQALELLSTTCKYVKNNIGKLAYTMKEGLTGLTLYDREPKISYDVENDERSELKPEFKEKTVERLHRGYLSTPVKNEHDQVKYVIRIINKRTGNIAYNHFTSYDLSLLNHIGNISGMLLNSHKHKINQQAFVQAISHDYEGTVKYWNYASIKIKDNVDLTGDNLKAVRAYVDDIIYESELLTMIMEDLNIRSFDSIKLEMDNINVVSDVINPSIDLLSKIFKYKDYNFVSEISKDTIIAADKRRIIHIFIHLLTNAAKYTKNNNPDIFIKEDQKTNGKEIGFLFENNGIEIPSGWEDRIFEKYERPTIISKDIPGTGFGLYFVRTMLEKMGGSVEVKSRENPVIFKVTLNKEK